MHDAIEELRRRWTAFSQTTFGCLVRLFAVRVFRGSADVEAGELDPGVGVIAILLAMPGTLVSLLTLEEFGSLLRFLRRQGPYDPFSASVPDEYFFIVLSLVVAGAVALWRWDKIFLDRRDYMNLVPLPVSLRAIFFANLCAIALFVALLTVVTNLTSIFLFPVAVVGSQRSAAVFIRFAAGHAAAVFLASAFGSCAVFAAAGILIALLPSSALRGVSVAFRFAGVLGLLALLATSLTVPAWLTSLPIPVARFVAMLPPVSFLGIARTVWGRGSEGFTPDMTASALAALALSLVMAAAAYTLSFRRCFIRTPERTVAASQVSVSRFASRLARVHLAFRRHATRRACYQFVTRTIRRSEDHLQVPLCFIGLALILSAKTIASVPRLRLLGENGIPPVEVLSVPFILSYCLVVGLRLSFEIPLDLRANWNFKLWVDPSEPIARPVARRVLLGFSFAWIGPTVFVSTAWFWGWRVALLHTGIWIACTSILIETVLVRFRKIPFTCPYPSFSSDSSPIAMAYVFSFFAFTGFLPLLDRRALVNSWNIFWLVALTVLALVGLYAYRGQMLEMDKQLIFEELHSPFE